MQNSLKITRVLKGKQPSPKSGDSYSAMINPASYELTELDENGSKYEILSFEIVIDCTGIVDPKRTSFNTEIDSLESTLYAPKSNSKKSNQVQLNWGSLNFAGKVKSYDSRYTLFKPDGTPLRGTVSLKFEKEISVPKKKWWW